MTDLHWLTSMKSIPTNSPAPAHAAPEEADGGAPAETGHETPVATPTIGIVPVRPLKIASPLSTRKAIQIGLERSRARG
jgi:hypothetical protein